MFFPLKRGDQHSASDSSHALQGEGSAQKRIQSSVPSLRLSGLPPLCLLERTMWELPLRAVPTSPHSSSRLLSPSILPPSPPLPLYPPSPPPLTFSSSPLLTLPPPCPLSAPEGAVQSWGSQPGSTAAGPSAGVLDAIWGFHIWNAYEPTDISLACKGHQF